MTHRKRRGRQLSSWMEGGRDSSEHSDSGCKFRMKACHVQNRWGKEGRCRNLHVLVNINWQLDTSKVTEKSSPEGWSMDMSMRSCFVVSDGGAVYCRWCRFLDTTLGYIRKLAKHEPVRAEISYQAALLHDFCIVILSVFLSDTLRPGSYKLKLSLYSTELL